MRRMRRPCGKYKTFRCIDLINVITTYTHVQSFSIFYRQSCYA